MEKPNVLIIVLDSQGINNLSCYGYHKKTSPNIDKIADDGVVFLNNFAPSTWTPPSHASLMTGRYLSCLGYGRNLMPKEKPTISEALNSIGYKTAAFSVNTLVNHEERIYGILRGFKEVYYPSVLRENERSTEEDLFRQEGEPPYDDGLNNDKVPFRKKHNDKGSIFTMHLVKNWIEKNLDVPFFIFVNCVEPHTPYWPGEPFRSRFLLDGTTEEQAKKIPQMAACPKWRAEHPWNTKIGEFGYPQSPQEWLIMQSLLDGETAQVDHRIGILSDYLREKGIYDNTLLIITSDHHDVLWEHRGKTSPDGQIQFSGHSSLYDPNIHVPLVVKGYPEHFLSGTHVSNMTDLTDIFPTLIDLLEIKNKRVKNSVQGYSLLSALNVNPKRKFILAEDRDGFFDSLPWYKAYRDNEYKYIWHSTGEEELYNILKDPYEQHNIITDMPEKGILLKKEMEKFLLSLDIPPIHFKKEAIKLMVAWGYYRQIRPTN